MGRRIGTCSTCPTGTTVLPPACRGSRVNLAVRTTPTCCRCGPAASISRWYFRERESNAKPLTACSCVPGLRGERAGPSLGLGEGAGLFKAIRLVLLVKFQPTAVLILRFGRCGSEGLGLPFDGLVKLAEFGMSSGEG